MIMSSLLMTWPVNRPYHDPTTKGNWGAVSLQIPWHDGI